MMAKIDPKTKNQSVAFTLKFILENVVKKFTKLQDIGLIEKKMYADKQSWL